MSPPNLPQPVGACLPHAALASKTAKLRRRHPPTPTGTPDIPTNRPRLRPAAYRLPPALQNRWTCREGTGDRADHACPMHARTSAPH